MDGDNLARMGLTLALLLGIPGVLLVAMRRFGLRLPGQPDTAGRLGIVSKLAVDNKHNLLLIRRDSHEQLILIGPGGVTLLEADVQLSTDERDSQLRQQAERDAQVAANRAALQQVLGRVRGQRAVPPSPPSPPTFSQMVETIRPPSLRRHLDRAA